jgi:hypothetical protein
VRFAVRTLGVVVGLVALALATHLFVYRDDWSAFRSIISGYTAKEACTCVHVLERDEAFCRELVRQWLPADALEFHPADKSVYSRGMGRSAVARFEGDGWGCRLLAPGEMGSHQ